MGTEIRPMGVPGTLSGKQILELKNCKAIEQIIVLKAVKIKERKKKRKNHILL
jgi:hypothetical protein